MLSTCGNLYEFWQVNCPLRIVITNLSPLVAMLWLTRAPLQFFSFVFQMNTSCKTYITLICATRAVSKWGIVTDLNEKTKSRLCQGIKGYVVATLPVENSSLMKVVHGRNSLPDKLPHFYLSEFSPVADVIHKISPRSQLRNQVIPGKLNCTSKLKFYSSWNKVVVYW